MYAVYIRISCIKKIRPPYQCMQLCVLDGYLRHGYMHSDLHYAVQPDSIIFIHVAATTVLTWTSLPC